MIKFRYKRKEPTNVAGNNNKPTTTTPTKAIISPLSKTSSTTNNSATVTNSNINKNQNKPPPPPKSISSSPQKLQSAQHNQLISNNGTLPRSTPKKIIDPQEGHKTATLTRNGTKILGNAKFLTTNDTSMLSLQKRKLASHINGFLNNQTNKERDRCINAVIVSLANNKII